MNEMSEGNIFFPNMCRVAMRKNIDSHYLLDAYDNVMMYGRRAFNGVQHQPIHMVFLFHLVWLIVFQLLPLMQGTMQLTSLCYRSLTTSFKVKCLIFYFLLFYYFYVGDLTLVRVKDTS